jgi:formate-dependent nitrite reductase cytochrome c552 subunit
VGFDPDVANGGSDDASDYGDFLVSGLLNNPGDNWTTMLAQFPETARLSNIQCENCHGPQNGDAHQEGDPRLSLSSDVCGVCHGEPLRHARFQQWQLSAHANYEVAIDEGDSGSCSRCHTANGFLTWLPVLTGDEPGDPLDDIFYCDDAGTGLCVGGANDGLACVDDDECPAEWTTDEIHPQTCATCHDPHSIGTTTGVDTNATVRISGNTPPLIAGFTAFGVGKGAICMTCHNTRRGLRNDDTWDATVADEDTARAPHGGAQADLLMGQNAYFVNVGMRGSHSLVEDSCVNCHMEQTPPPDLLSYNLGGTNHTFFASTEICSNCHGDGFNANGVQDAADATLEGLESLIEEMILDLIEDLIVAGNVIDLDGEATITDAADILAIEFGEYRGRQAITVTFLDATTVGPVRMSDIGVLDAGTLVLQGELYDFADERLPKAGWNWNLVNNDGSRGVHNPDFTFLALDSAIDELIALWMAP